MTITAYDAVKRPSDLSLNECSDEPTVAIWAIRPVETDAFRLAIYTEARVRFLQNVSDELYAHLDNGDRVPLTGPGRWFTIQLG